MFAALVELIGRILFAALFLIATGEHFGNFVTPLAEKQNIPAPEFFVMASGIIALFGGLSIFFGFLTRWGAALIIIFLIPITFTIHNFWDINNDPHTWLEQFYNFWKNLALTGGALFLLYYGAGPWSIDYYRKRSK